MNAIRFGTAVTFEIDAQLTARRFDRAVNGTLWCGESFGPQLKMMDKRLHAYTDLRTRRRDEFTIIRVDGSHRKFVQCLLNDLHRLAKFLDVNNIAREGIAFGAGGDIEIILFITAIGARLAQIPVDA